MNHPKHLFYLNVPAELTLCNEPDLMVKVETEKIKETVITNFVDLNTVLVTSVTNWLKLWRIASDRSNEVWANQNATAIGTITDNNSVMPGIIHNMNTVTKSEIAINN